MQNTLHIAFTDNINRIKQTLQNCPLWQLFAFKWSNFKFKANGRKFLLHRHTYNYCPAKSIYTFLSTQS